MPCCLTSTDLIYRDMPMKRHGYMKAFLERSQWLETGRVLGMICQGKSVD